MKLKNVKIGVKVKLKEDCGSLKKGMLGVIIENEDYFPYISWDNFTDGHNGLECEHARIGLGLPESSVSAVPVNYLKRLKEEI